jgi:hypothetical protein
MPITVTLKESAGFDLHEPDEWYPGHIVGIEETGDNGFGPGLKWLINLEVDDEDRETWAFCSQKFSPKSRLYAWVSGIDSTVIPQPGGVLDLESLIGRTVDVMFEHYQGTTPEGQAVTKEKVVKLRSSKSIKAVARAKPQVKAKKEEPAEEPF